MTYEQAIHGAQALQLTPQARKRLLSAMEEVATIWVSPSHVLARLNGGCRIRWECGVERVTMAFHATGTLRVRHRINFAPVMERFFDADYEGSVLAGWKPPLWLLVEAQADDSKQSAPVVKQKAVEKRKR
jgi:hypothetical protein